MIGRLRWDGLCLQSGRRRSRGLSLSWRSGRRTPALGRDRSGSDRARSGSNGRIARSRITAPRARCRAGIPDPTPEDPWTRGPDEAVRPASVREPRRRGRSRAASESGRSGPICPARLVGSVPGPRPTRGADVSGPRCTRRGAPLLSRSPACGAFRRGGRAVEGARLESVYGGNSIAGSNPAPSAIISREPKS